MVVKATPTMISPDSDRWWPAVRASSLLAIPPFPGSTPAPFADGRTSGAITVSEAQACIDAMRRLRVGGSFWAAQPTLPEGAIVLARPRDLAQYRTMAAHAAQTGQSVTFWFPDDRSARASGAAVGSAIVGPCDPWHLLARASDVWAAPDDELGLLAGIAGVAWRAFDMAEEPIAPVDRIIKLLGGVDFRDPFSRSTITAAAFIELLGYWRSLIDANRPIEAIFGVAFWKRSAVAPLLWDGSAADRFRTTQTRDLSAAAAWIARTPRTMLSALREAQTPIHQIEDGFIRSAGLGADCVPPLSIVVDAEGAHYDPAQPSGLETLLQDGEFDPAMLDRAGRLRALIVSHGITKYAAGEHGVPCATDGRRHVLVTGQVEDDQSVLLGGGGVAGNLDLLRRVRVCEPEAFITYRPHPDVDAGHRKGHIADEVALTLADNVAREPSITTLIDATDHVHVLTSLAGFEALLRGKRVTTHGVPFYAGWGLTEDLGPVPSRRTTQRSLDELIAATLLLYPRYLDPLTGLPCPPEILVERIAAGMGRQNVPLVAARRLVGTIMRQVRRLPSVRR